jgi:hypothetical protein
MTFLECFSSVSVVSGKTQNKLNTGDPDASLANAGLAVEQIEAKKKGCRINVRQFYGVLKRVHANDRIHPGRQAWNARSEGGNIITGSFRRNLGKSKE